MSFCAIYRTVVIVIYKIPYADNRSLGGNIFKSKRIIMRVQYFSSYWDCQRIEVKVLHVTKSVFL